MILCGRPSSSANGLWDKACGTPRACPGGEAFATVTLVNGRWTNPVVWCPSTSTPAVTLAGIRQQVERLLPRVDIGIAPPGGTTLVNIQTVLWANTAPDRTLPDVTVVGRRVALRIHLTAARWDFGDRTSDSSTGPGKPYDGERNPCRTKQCPGYYGHTYRQTGKRTITLTLTWHAQYNAGGGWVDVLGDLTGPSAKQQLTVKEARAVLVPNPGDH